MNSSEITPGAVLLSSVQLDECVKALPVLAEPRGLKIGPEILGSDFAIVFAPGVSLIEALDVAVTMGAVMVFPGLDRFDPDDIDLDEVELAGIVRRGAQPGDLRRIRIHWIAQGMNFVWVRKAALFVDVEREAMFGWSAAEAKAQHEADEELRLLEDGSRDAKERVNRVKTRILNNPIFRATTKRQRPSVAETVAGPRPDDQADMHGRAMGINDAVAGAKNECSRWNREVSSRLHEVAEEFAQSGGWLPFESTAAKRRAAAEFLIVYTGGWRLENSLSDRLLEQAENAKNADSAFTANLSGPTK